MAGGHHHYDEDDEKGEGVRKALKDWDCPDCNANNPVNDPVEEGDEIRCNYCGEEYKVAYTDAGRLKLKSV